MDKMHVDSSVMNSFPESLKNSYYSEAHLTLSGYENIGLNILHNLTSVNIFFENSLMHL